MKISPLREDCPAMMLRWAIAAMLFAGMVATVAAGTEIPSQVVGLIPQRDGIFSQLDHHSGDDGDRSARPPVRREEAKGSGAATAGGGETWTYLFYADADFTDAYAPLADFAAEAFSGDHLDVVVLQDLETGPATLWRVEADHSLTLLEDWGEPNMGDSATLRDFIAWGKTNYPANRYFLGVYDHGMSWSGACLDTSSGFDWLTMDEFQQAFEEAGGVDIIAFTAPCNMGSFEAAYELRDWVEVYIGSEDVSGYIHWRGMIDEMCHLLNTTPQPPVDEIAATIVSLVEANEIDPWFMSYRTMSAVRAGELGDVAVGLDSLAGHLVERLDSCGERLSVARGMSRHFLTDSWGGRYQMVDVDLLDFTRRLAALESDPVLLQDLGGLGEAMDRAVIAECHGTGQPGAGGLTLYFPGDSRYYDDSYTTSSLDFCTDTGWNEFLTAYLDRGPTAVVVTGPGPAVVNPPLVRLHDTAAPAQPVRQWMSYGVAAYGVNVAAGDLFGGETAIIITGPGPGAVFGPHVRGFTPLGDPLPGLSFLAYGTNKYGVNVAAGNLDFSVYDSYDDIVTGAGPGAVFGPHVRGWRYDRVGGVVPFPGLSFFAYGTNKYGVNVACGDLNGDLQDEIVTGAGPGAVFGPHVRGWSYNSEAGQVAALTGLSFMAYGTNRYGVNVACGDLSGNEVESIITGPGPGAMFGPQVRAWNWDGSQVTPMESVNFFAYPEGMFGVSVATADLDFDGREEIITIPGPDAARGARVCVWNVDGGEVSLLDGCDFDAYQDLQLMMGGTAAGGVY